MAEPDVAFTRPTSALDLQRTTQMLFPVLSRFMFEAELVPMLTLSRTMHAQMRREIAHAQSQERIKYHRMRVEIEDQRSRHTATRSTHSSACAHLDAQMLELVLSLTGYRIDGYNITSASVSTLTTLVTHGGRLELPVANKYSMSKLVGCLMELVEDAEPPAAADPALMARFIQLCLLSNPELRLSLGRGSDDADVLVQIMMRTILSRYSFSNRPRAAVNIRAMRAAADLCGWLIQLCLLQPPTHWSGRWASQEEILLRSCCGHLARDECRTSAEMIQLPDRTHEVAELRQMRWSLIRQCAGGPDASRFSARSLLLNAPFLLPLVHPHGVAYYDQPHSLIGDPICAMCQQPLSHIQPYYTCGECMFNVHTTCVTETEEGRNRGFRARSAEEIQQDRANSSAQANIDVDARADDAAVPSAALDDLRYFVGEWFRRLPVPSAPAGLLYCLLECSSSFSSCVRMALNLPRHHRCCEMLYGFMEGASSRQQLFAMLTTPSSFRRRVLQINEIADPPSSGSDSSASSCSSRMSPIRLAAPDPAFAFVFFQLLMHKERGFITRWLKFDRRYFAAIWSSLIDSDTGCSPLHYLVAHVRGCREHIFVLLARFTCHALRIKPADLLSQRTVAGQSLAAMLAWERNRDLRGIIEELATSA